VVVKTGVFSLIVGNDRGCACPAAELLMSVVRKLYHGYVADRNEKKKACLAPDRPRSMYSKMARFQAVAWKQPWDSVVGIDRVRVIGTAFKLWELDQ